MALKNIFDFTRPGPGVSKNGPKKRSFFLFWELYFRKFWKLIQVNLIYVLFSLPLVTIGLADAGITYVTRNFVREKHAFVWADFVGAIKKNWKQALPLGLLNWTLEIVLIIDVFYYSNLNVESAVTATAFSAVSILLLLVFSFMRYYIPMMIVTFDLKWKQLYKNALIFAFAAVFRNLLISLYIFIFWFLVLAGIVSGNYFLLSALLLYYLLFYHSFRAFLIQFCIFPKVKKHMIDPYYEAHPEAGKKEKRALNIEDEESIREDKEQAVFEDRGRTDSYLSENEQKENLPAIPKQYSEREMRRFRSSQRRAAGRPDDDDDTI